VSKAEVAVLRGELKGEIATLRLEVTSALVRMDAKLDTILNMLAGQDQRITNLEQRKQA
jgi:hypothetical protein